MKRLIQISTLLIATLFMISCGSDSGGPNPEVTGIQPTSGPPGSSVTISGKGFRPKGTMSVTFGGTSATLISATKDQIQTEVPQGLSEGSAPVEVTVEGVTASGPSFTVEQAAPGITSVEPDSGTVGTEVIIKGMNFSPTASENSISFNGTVANVKSATESQFVTEVPQGASDGPIEVTVKQKSTTSPPFDVITEGVLEIITTTGGSSRDEDGYMVSVDANNAKSISPDDTLYVPNISKGNHDVELTGVASNCSVDGANPRSKSVIAGDTTSTEFVITCEATANNKIAVSSFKDGNTEIYLVNEDGSDPIRLTNNSSVDSNPIISNDGKKIAFTSDRNGDHDIYVMDVDGSNMQRITNESYIYPIIASWSPDNSKIAYGASGQSGYSNIYTINVNGTNKTKLTDSNGNDSYPSWSPDGQKIAFQSDRAHPNGGFINGDDIFSVTVKGNNITAITDDDAEYDSPRWSPDGSKIAVISNNSSDNEFELYTMDANGAGMQRLTNNNIMELSPSWSPDGSEIVYEADDNIYTITANSPGSEKVMQTISKPATPFWSPVK